MCDLCRADENYFHTAECVYDQLVSEYPVMWLRDSTRIGACYTLRELLSPEGMVLAIQNSLPMKGWRLRMLYNEAIDEEINPLHGDCIELPSRADALQAFVGSGSLPQLLKTDNGSEFEDFAKIEAWGSSVYFAHPYSSWERPVNERHNGLLRQYIPKGISIEKYSAEDVLWFADELNSRPRKRLGYRTPEELFEAFLDKIYAA
mgnify:CR=1 FL=1